MTAQDSSAKQYIPLAMILVVISLTSGAISLNFHTDMMPIFMGLFLVVFAMFKLIDLDGFAHGFSLYDVVAKKFPAYAKLYPVIELTLGLLYLSGLFPVAASVLTIIIMGVGSIGILKSLRSGLKIKCACLGTAINLSLSFVSLFENGCMIALALTGLARRFMF